MLDDALDRRFATFAATRDPRALADVFDASSATLLRIARHLARDDAEAEDIVQATFLSVMERAEQYDTNRPLMPWLIGILHHHAADARRRAQRCLDVTRLPRESARDAADEAAVREFFADLAGALGRLPDRDRVVLAAHIDGLSSPAIGRRLGLSDGAVRVRIHRGLQRLRRTLPPGFLAGALFVAIEPRGLGAIRTVVTRACAVSVASGTSAFLGGLSIMKMLAAAAVAAALVLTTWIALERDPPIVTTRPQAAMPGTHSTESRPAAVPDSNPETPSGENVSTSAIRVATSHASNARMGRVVSDPELTPIAGARVRGFDADGAVDFETTSALDGSFVLPSTFVAQDRLIGFVIAQAPGFARGRDATYSDSNTSSDAPLADIRLVRAATIEGVVRAEAGGGLAGVRVEVFDELGPWLERVTCITGAVGEFVLTGFRPAATRSQALRVVDDRGRCLAVDVVPVAQPVVRHDVVVRAAATLEVAVVGGSDRSPIAQATVVVLGSLGAQPVALDLDDVPVGSVGSTANTGVVRIADLFGSSVDVIATAPHHAWASTRVDIRAGEVVHVEVALPRAARVAGIVVDPAGGAAAGIPLWIETDVADPTRFDLDAPLARVRRLRFADQDVHPFANGTTTGADGRFAFDRVPAKSSARIVLGATQLGSPRQEFGPFPLAPGDDRPDLVIPARGTRRLEIRVFDEHGAPLTAGVTIGSQSPAAWVSSPDEHGTFVLDLPSGVAPRLAVAALGFRPRFVELGANERGRVEVHLARGFTLEGTVVDAGGLGLEGVSVVASTATTADAEERTLATWFPDRATTWSTTTDANGHFVLSPLPSTRVDLAVFLPEFGSTMRADVAVESTELVIPLVGDSR